MKELTLVVLAAGMGSRYGGIKQLDPLGPAGENLMDYSVYDAIRAGFKRIVFIIRRDIEAAFKESIGKRYAGKINMEYAFQEFSDLPGSFKTPETRQKPWGTGHALYAARHLLTDTPFAVINADDFYGAGAYQKLAEYLSAPPSFQSGKVRGCIVAYTLSRTTSPNGSVSRGICEGGKTLRKVVEHTKIFHNADNTFYSLLDDGSKVPLQGNEPASMNCWGFMPEFLPELERLFAEFLRDNVNEPKKEFYLPFAVDALIRSDCAEIAMLHTDAPWFGITYHEDRDNVVKALADLTGNKVYPTPLFGK